jgi:hypothetical protein
MKRKFAYKMYWVITAVNIKITVFCDIVLCILADGDQSFEETFYFHFLYLKRATFFPVLYNYQNGTEAVNWQLIKTVKKQIKKQGPTIILI